ncbi:MAG: hypothetical protein WBM90_07300, partial [Acidimicrobiia bacterium]
RYVAVVAAQNGETERATKLMAAAESAGRLPYGSEASHWNQARDGLVASEGHAIWTNEGSQMSLEEAMKLAMTR